MGCERSLTRLRRGIRTTQLRALTFSNGDIYTILSEGEILRLYDNVPRLAKAQTIMGNRIMYGNYLEGYDLKDVDGRDIQLTYVAEQESAASESFVKEEDRSCVGCLFYPPTGNYQFTGATQVGATNVENEMLVDLNAIPVEDLVDGATISIAIEVRPTQVFTSNPASLAGISQFYYPFVNSNTDEVPVGLRPTTTVEFVYTVVGNHTDVSSAFSGSAWNAQIGTPNNIQQNILNAPNGFTFTDNYNASVAVPYPIDNNYDEP
jgi:hypothetical protein